MVIDRLGDGSYTVRARSVPELEDPRRLSGTLGTGYRGGKLLVEEYRPGARLDIEYVAEGDVGVPLYDDGLILWSFYAHLADTRREITDLGYDIEPSFPIDIAWSPASVLDFSAVENAAYSPGAEIFVIFPDLLGGAVPLAGNAGIVRHEFGHAWFDLITGSMGEEAESDSTTLAVRALNEGWADTVATLLLDDPAFLEPSLNMPARDVSGDATATADLYPPFSPTLTELLSYDPYLLGTVFASLAWDIREATTPEIALGVAFYALTRWADEGVADDIDRFAELLVEETPADALEEACAAHAARFPANPPPDPCATR